MTGGASIREYRSEDRANLAALYRRFFGGWAWERFQARWEWQFRTNPWAASHPICILVGESQGQLVGHATSYPLPFRRFGAIETIWCSGDLVTESHHGLLAFSLAQQVERKRAGMSTGMRREAERIAAFQGNRTIPATVRGFRFPLRTTGTVQRALRRRLPGPLRGLAARPLAATLELLRRSTSTARARALPGPMPAGLSPCEHFGPAHAAVWRGMCAWVECALERSPEYLNWRYVQGPARELVRLELAGDRGELRGFAVGGVRAVLADDRVPCGTLGEILEIVVRDVEDTEAVRTLAHGLLVTLAARGVDEVGATGLADPFVAPLQELGFEVHEAGAKIMLNSAVPEQARVTAPGTRWYASGGDGDQLYTTLL